MTGHLFFHSHMFFAVVPHINRTWFLVPEFSTAHLHHPSFVFHSQPPSPDILLSHWFLLTAPFLPPPVQVCWSQYFFIALIFTSHTISLVCFIVSLLLFYSGSESTLVPIWKLTKPCSFSKFFVVVRREALPAHCLGSQSCAGSTKLGVGGGWGVESAETFAMSLNI